MKAILGSLLVGLLAVGVAQAGDLCLDATNASNPPTDERPIIILRGFKFPKKNKCKPFAGVIATSPSRASAVTGAACTRFDGTGVSFSAYATLAPVPAQPPFIIQEGVELRYSVTVAPTGKDTGSGLLSLFQTTSTSTVRVVTFECHNAFPDNL